LGAAGNGFSVPDPLIAFEQNKTSLAGAEPIRSSRLGATNGCLSPNSTERLRRLVIAGALAVVSASVLAGRFQWNPTAAADQA
jgi:hypothetical protein